MDMDRHAARVALNGLEHEGTLLPKDAALMEETRIRRLEFPAPTKARRLPFRTAFPKGRGSPRLSGALKNNREMKGENKQKN